MEMLGVTIPGTHLVKPGVISSGLAAQRLLDRGIDQDADNHRILRSSSDERSMSVGPQFRINVAQIERDHIGPGPNSRSSRLCTWSGIAAYQISTSRPI